MNLLKTDFSVRTFYINLRFDGPAPNHWWQSLQVITRQVVDREEIQQHDTIGFFFDEQ